jgi:hypothetical protein
MVTKCESGGEPWVRLTQSLPQAHAGQGGVTLGRGQGELGADFTLLVVKPSNFLRRAHNNPHRLHVRFKAAPPPGVPV